MGNCNSNNNQQNFLNSMENINLNTSTTNSTNNTFVFTRYLYEKEEVKYALLFSLLNKKEDALFWAYELYYSGFREELFHLLFTIYYDFYASLNPSFETYLHNKMNLILQEPQPQKQPNNDSINDSINDSNVQVSIIIHNFMIRPHTTDVFFMRIFVNQLKFVLPSQQLELENDLLQLLSIEDYMTIARILFYELNQTNLKQIFDTIVKYFTEKKALPIKKTFVTQAQKRMKDYPTFARHMLFSKLMHLVCLEKKVQMGKNLYVHVEPEEIVLYETIFADLKEEVVGNGSKRSVLPAYKILPLSTMYSIDEHSYLSLFQLKREKMNIRDAYLDNWLFYASFSPIWRKRILDAGGVIDEINKLVTFSSDDTLEEFYEKYGYEPDEQKKEMQNKTIQEIRKERSWRDIYKQHKNRGVIEIEEMYFDNLEKISYF